MERSIENIWKKGFKAEEKLSLPVISNLYKRKSGLIIDQISNTSKKDNLSLLPMAVVIFGVFAFIGKVMLGIYLAVFIIALFFLNKKMLNDLKDLDIKDNTYNYFSHFVPRVRGLRRMGAARYDIVSVAAGRLDGYWEMYIKVWDIAAGLLIIGEAGGVYEYIPNKKEHSIVTSRGS